MNSNRKAGLRRPGMVIPVFMLLATSVPGQESGTLSTSGYVQFGGGYSSNPDIVELEVASGASDHALLAEAGFELGWRPQQHWRIDGGYTFRGNRHGDIDELDLLSHLVYVDISHDLEGMTIGGNYYFSDASLDGNRFLQMHQTSAYVGRMFNDDWYVRAALNFTDKDFRKIPVTITDYGPNGDARDADSLGFSVDGFWFFSQGTSSLNVGYDYEEENTRADRFDYDAITFRAVFHHEVIVLDRDAVMKLGHRVQLRDYRHATPDIGRRDDTRNVLDANLVINWTQNLDLIGTVERAMYDSDLPAADYNENSIKLSGKIKF